ncbi:hypothetical protein P7K49_009185, partial [Saguinus oedipus]
EEGAWLCSPLHRASPLENMWHQDGLYQERRQTQSGFFQMPCPDVWLPLQQVQPPRPPPKGVT